MGKKPGIITQARMGSTRLPGKVMLQAGGHSLLDIHVQRLRHSKIEFVIATTEEKQDDIFISYCKHHELNCYRGSEHDVLKRFLETAEIFELDPIVRVTSDCPFVDPWLIRKALEEHLAEHSNDLYTSNVVKRTFPRGFDLEIFSFDLLKAADERAIKTSEREHVTPWIRENAESKHHIICEENTSQFRLTVDTIEDLELIRKLVEEHHAHELPYSEIIGIMKTHPHYAEINAHTKQKES